MKFAHNEEGHKDDDVKIMLIASAIMLIVFMVCV